MLSYNFHMLTGIKTNEQKHILKIHHFSSKLQPCKKQFSMHRMVKINFYIFGSIWLYLVKLNKPLIHRIV